MGLNMTPTVLVLGNERHHGDMLKSSLMNEGYNVISAENAFSIMSAIYREQPQAIVIDVMTPWVSSFELCKQIKQSDRFQDIKIIFVADSPCRDTVKKFESAGCDGYIAKPFKLADFLNTVRAQIPFELS